MFDEQIFYCWLLSLLNKYLLALSLGHFIIVSSIYSSHLIYANDKIRANLVSYFYLEMECNKKVFVK